MSSDQVHIHATIPRLNRHARNVIPIVNDVRTASDFSLDVEPVVDRSRDVVIVDSSTHDHVVGVGDRDGHLAVESIDLVTAADHVVSLYDETGRIDRRIGAVSVGGDPYAG